MESDAASTWSSQIYDDSRGELCSLYYKEAVELVKLAGPAFLSRLMIFLISFVSTVFCGRLGETELTGVALAIAVINVTCLSVGSGLASGCDTLISQTFGSNNLMRVGVILQRGILIILLACFPCWALLINTEPILLAVKQSPSVASVAQRYVKIFMPALPMMSKSKSSKLAKKGLTPSQIGVILRDSHGVSPVRFVTGNKILRILKSKCLATDLPEDLYNLIKKAVAVRKHLERNRKDKDAKFRLILVETESRIHRLARYYNTKRVLTPNWKYKSSTASALGIK
ncbi:multidrug and toxin extrusion protein 1 [Triplophysa rosa]|uniref:Small ribosomal subunit protein uS15 n=1 Tax=Triplophysa rosa TaxID=992332 RepID=A0A9W7TFX5_TRIRA|nr:multidrug and toxin extrusion protein 1 [Triplophysa rosa]